MYVSITGLRLRRWWHYPRFMMLAVPALGQARRADGNLHVAARTVRGVHHTLTAWRSRPQMQAYIRSGAHRVALGAFGRIATGRTFGYESDTLPDWDEVHRRWHEHGIDYA